MVFEKSFLDLEVYAGYYLDDEKVWKSASGGFATILSEWIIKLGGVVFGSTYSDDYKSAEYYCAETIEELEKLKGSKYIFTKKQVKQNNEYISVYKLLEEKLKEGKKALFTGLGCDIAVAYTYLHKKEVDVTNFYTLDLICHGPTYEIIGKQFIEYLEKKYDSRVADFSVRYKKERWMPPYVRAEFTNGKVYEKPFYETDYGYAFRRYSLRHCYSCRFRGKEHKSDITVGDYLGLKENMKEYNPGGVSVAIPHTDKGRWLIMNINRDIFKVERTDTEFVLKCNPAYYKNRNLEINRDIFEKNVKNKGLHYAVVNDQGLGHYCMLLIEKQVRRMLPRAVKNMIKNIRGNKVRNKL